MSFDALKDAIARKEVLLVAGAGVSANIAGNVPTSTWIGLVRDGIERVADSDRRALLELRLAHYEGGGFVSDLIGIASDVRKELERNDSGDFGRWLTKTIGSLPIANRDLPTVLSRLGVPIFTTNYDTLLERSMSLESATWAQPDRMRAIARHEDTSVGHLHGLYSAVETVIFDDEDYRRVLADQAAQTVQTAAFTMKSFLFIGFGSGTDDPNFKMMLDHFKSAFTTTTSAHFRLCLAGESRPNSDISSVSDLEYGTDFSDLPSFLAGLVPDKSVAVPVNKRSQSFDRLLDSVRDNSTLWRDNDSLEKKTLPELVVTPVFLPEPHDQYATSNVLENERSRPDPVDIHAEVQTSKFVIVAGEENAGVSTALAWILNEAMLRDTDLHSHLVDEPLVAGPHPIGTRLQRRYRDWGVENGDYLSQLGDCVLGIDNLRYEQSNKFDRVVADLASLATRTTVIGVRQQDAVEVANALRGQGVSDIVVTYLGRFSNSEAEEIAQRMSPGNQRRVVAAVMIVIREKRLPRNPFTITLLVELILAGKKLSEQESEIAVLDKYLDVLLISDFGRTNSTSELTLRNKRVVLVAIARKFVELREDKAPQAELVAWISALFTELGWPYDALSCIEDLLRRRVLSKGSDNTIHFQRSAYLELMAGIAAEEDEEFRKLVFKSPLELSSIVRTYAAMSRSDPEVLKLMETQIDRITTAPPAGAIFGRIRQLEAQSRLFNDGGESDEDDDAPSERNGVAADYQEERYYDGTDDADRPAFLSARVEDLPPARVAMLVVDLASRVLRDTDEIRDQKLKSHILQKLLTAWVGFVDLFEAELGEAPGLDEAVQLFHKDDDLDEKELDAHKAALLRVVPSYLAMAGLRYCLSGPSLVPLLKTVVLDSTPNAEYAGLIRTLALYTSGSSSWIASLSQLKPEAAKSWFSAAFLSSIARYAYIADVRLTDGEREALREFLRDAIGVRYSFKGHEQRNTLMNRFEDDLRKASLKERARPRPAIAALP